MRNRRKPARAPKVPFGNIQFRDDEVQVIDGQQCLSEAGMYRAVLLSQTPAAMPLVDWIVREVIPAIEKKGAYVMPVNMSIPLPGPVGEAYAERLDEMRRDLEQRAGELFEKSRALAQKANELSRQLGN